MALMGAGGVCSGWLWGTAKSRWRSSWTMPGALSGSIFENAAISWGRYRHRYRHWKHFLQKIFLGLNPKLDPLGRPLAGAFRSVFRGWAPPCLLVLVAFLFMALTSWVLREMFLSLTNRTCGSSVKSSWETIALEEAGMPAAKWRVPRQWRYW